MLAKHTVTGERVAIKVITKEMVKKQGLMEQIQREISVMKLVRHPNAVDFCHSRGVSHRDLKPENLLLDDIVIFENYQARY